MGRPAEPTPRVPREEVRRRLLTAATRVFADRGCADSGLEDVARARRARRETVTALVTELTERHGVRLTAAPETVALALHCLTNGLSVEHLADPDAVDRQAIETTLVTALAGFAARPVHEESA